MLHFTIVFFKIDLMARYQPSIRNKIRHTYYIGIALIITIALLNYFYLRAIDYEIESSFIISDLFDTTLEMRRFEKNYFLYGHEEDYSENLMFTEKAKNIINRNEDAFKKLVIKGNINIFKSNILQYRAIVQEHFNMNKIPAFFKDQLLEERIRNKGREIVDFAEGITIAERKYMQSLIVSSQRLLIGSGVFLIIVGFFIAQYLFRMVITPLKRLENNMHSIAEGNFSFMSILSPDMEMISLSKAINTMLLELDLRQKHLIQSEKLASSGTLLFGVAHELNNPLSNISTSCEILKEEMDGPDAAFKKELLSHIETETDRARDIIRTVLGFSREGKKEMINLSGTVRESVRLIKGEIRSTVEIHVEVPDDISLPGDKQKLQQVFLNLIKNAEEAITGEGTIYITARKNKDRMIEIEIKDTGTGMETEIVSKIFDPFFSRKETEKGYGLGLFIVHKIIEEHGGTIDVESEPGYGTTFLIKLPVEES